MQAAFTRYVLQFKTPSGTSRGILREKETYFIKIWETASPDIFGIGECALFRGLSAEDNPEYEAKLAQVCHSINDVTLDSLKDWSSIRFGLETALNDLRNGGRRVIFPGEFVQGKQKIEINGLIWMGDRETMKQRIEEKLRAGFRCIKLKIGAIDFSSELDLLQYIRSRFNKHTVELRVDANGAFDPAEALQKLQMLSRYDLHSIEQPVRQGQWEVMAELCRRSPVPIVLEEELIGINDLIEKTALLETIRPAYIILKPALAGGFSGSSEWISLAEERGIGWWMTSALESNVGLNAIAQWTGMMPVTMPQGLGTGGLYVNNIGSPLYQNGSSIAYDPQKEWILPMESWK